MSKKFPIGIQSFEKIRSDDFYYVDKTPFVKKLVDEGGGYYFLSRPRRFGKSLFLDTLRQAFLGKRELFEGLYLEENWDWSVKYPVIYISFGAGVIRSPEELVETSFYILRRHAEDYEVTLTERLYNKRFEELILRLYRKCGQKVVVLIDEYDKPILDNIDHLEVAAEIREGLKNFYSVIKDADPYLKFCFITGVSKFSKVSLFSGLNNLKDLTLHPYYATICGYTQSEFETVFADRLDDVDLELVKRWYNGYSWLGEPVYNPFDILLFLDLGELRPYWFETGTPAFLIKLLIEKKYFIPQIEDLPAGEELLGSFDVDRIEPETLLFQTGYLTIKGTEEILPGEVIYYLGYPNLEVKRAFTDHLLTYFVSDLRAKNRNKMGVARALKAGDVQELIEVFRSFFASIPYDWYRKNELAGYEGYYASIFYCYFTALGLEVRVEDATNHGRLVMAVIFEGRCYLFEFKVVELEAKGQALEQLKSRKYHEKYRSQCQEIWLIGVEFSKEERNIVDFEIEKLSEI